jgi:membrane-bound lytic murein transglycosylase D
MTLYLEVSLFLTISFFIWNGISRLVRPTELLKLSKVLALISIIFPTSLILFTPVIREKIQSSIWSQATFSLKDLGVMKYPGFFKYNALSTNIVNILRGSSFFNVIVTVVTLCILSQFIWNLLGLFRIMRLIKTGQVVRKIGRLSILKINRNLTPFSFWFAGRAYIVFSTSNLQTSRQYKMAILHELQHHRQRDTTWVYFFQIMKNLFIWNPFVFFWERQISFLREWACDESVVRRKGFIPSIYSSCLIEIIEQSMSASAWHSWGAIGLGTSRAARDLKKRIGLIFSYPKKMTHRYGLCLIYSLVVFIFGFVTFLSFGKVTFDKKLTLNQVLEIEKLSQASDFRVVVNESVVKELNRLIGTPDSRKYVRESIIRMNSYKFMIEEKLRKYSLPNELLAIPIVESGYRNFKRHNGKEAGIWMWEAQPRDFQIEITEKIDKRLDPDTESDVVFSYLRSRFEKYRDWPLTILELNTGHTNIDYGMKATKTKNGWDLVAAGYENDPGYLPMVMAAILILRNPSILD